MDTLKHGLDIDAEETTLETVNSQGYVLCWIWDFVLQGYEFSKEKTLLRNENGIPTWGIIAKQYPPLTEKERLEQREIDTMITITERIRRRQ